MPDTDPCEEAAALRSDLEARLAGGDLGDVEARLERLGAIAEALEDDALRGEWLLLAARWLHRRGGHAAAEQRAVEAAQTLAAAHRLDRESHALLAAAEMARADARRADAAAHQSAALALARRSGDLGLVVLSAGRLADSLWELGEWADAELHHAEAYAVARAAGRIPEANQIAREALKMAAHHGRWHVARQAGQRLFPNGAASDAPAGLSLAEWNHALAAYGQALRRTGERDAAREFLAAAESQPADLTGLQDL